ncbi:TIGR03087 family PEP-CTERM/XrtA system glycosyltransferase [Lacimicrobium alkaliphilum]|uniref:Glycosyl transferase n=1 Tax=Lacimicrobium alkaliphilum TaxID=1526571 RepID=A0ABQ1RK21_9ALTE|nr:TIGR03087 family PEP-CTERM/XrtA system glycosyltransferase [Lacimicrobium alkaliphilum]GGD69070.1 glycosyl transferase [Lacimicrobium alkaliphilum]
MTKKEPLLFLCHRIPFPPNKGDKIRSFNILKQLSDKYDIYLAAFVDDDNDWQYEKDLQPYCKEVLLVRLHPLRGKIKGLSGMLFGKPISLPYFHSSRIQQWVKQIIDSAEIKKGFVYSSAMAQYIEDVQLDKRVADFVDVDSDKWRQYANNTANPLLKLVYNWESRTLASYEKKITTEFDAVTLVSEDEAAFFREQLPAGLATKVDAFPNGVDGEFFNPDTSGPRPIEAQYLVFTGAMDYWANVDAVLWFVEHVWPVIHKQHPAMKFAIVGGNPVDKVKALARLDNILVTGRVEDIRPYIKHAQLAVAPLRIARGIQNKVLEAMAMEQAVVMTSMAAEGIRLPANQQPLVSDEADLFAGICLEMLAQPEKMAALGHENREWIAHHYQWQAVVEKLAGVLK